MQGLARALIHNMVVGLSEGFKKELAIVGVGYKAQLSGSKLVLNLTLPCSVLYSALDAERLLDNRQILLLTLIACITAGVMVLLAAGLTRLFGIPPEQRGLSKFMLVFTNSAFIAGYVRSIPGARVVLLGGSYDPDAQVMSGPLVGKCAEEFYVDKFFIGTDGYDPNQGFSNVDMLRAEAVRAMAARADKRIILTDESKFNKRGVVQLMPARQVTHVITNAVPENCRASLID
ncbi:MAG: hypothetical protein EOM69_13355, partial [Clostridia bacterium]|nr:hypothetical protein [Clostridia bacterium]